MRTGRGRMLWICLSFLSTTGLAADTASALIPFWRPKALAASNNKKKIWWRRPV